MQVLITSGTYQGKEWQILAAEELEGKALVAAERQYNVVEHALSATNLHNLFFEAFIAVAIQVEEHGTDLGDIPTTVRLLCAPTALHQA